MIAAMVRTNSSFWHDQLQARHAVPVAAHAGTENAHMPVGCSIRRHQRSALGAAAQAVAG